MSASKSTKLTNETNYEIAQETNQANLDIANATNEANYRIAQMNNDYNEQLLERQIDEQWKMWNAQNEYNSASSQRERLAEAGMNPYMMMDGGSAGTASAMTSPSPQPGTVIPAQGATMEAAQMQNPATERIQILQTIINSLQGLADTVGGVPDTINKVLDAQQKQMSLPALVKSAIAESNIKANDAFWRQTKNAQEAAGRDILNYANTFMALIKTKEFSYMDVNQALSMTGHFVQICNDVETGKLTAAEARKALSEARVLERTEDARVKRIESDAEHASNNMGTDNPWQIYQEIGRNLASALPSDNWLARIVNTIFGW